MLIPPLIRKILATTALTAAGIALFWAARDWRTASVFLGASFWAMGNLVIWALFSYVMLRMPGDEKAIPMAGIGLGKLALFGGGLAALVALKPLSGPEIIGVVGGVSLTLIISLLLALGARLTGRDMSEGLPEAPERAGKAVPELGGKV